MKTKLIALIMLLVVSLTAFAQQKKTVAVLNPVCRDNSASNIYFSIVRGSFESVVSATEGYEAYDRTALDQIMQEHGFQRSGAVDDAQIRQLGQFAGVDYVLVTEISADEGYMMVIAKVLNVTTAKYDRSVDDLMEMTPPKVKTGCTKLAQSLFKINMSTGQQSGEIRYNGCRYVGEYRDGKPQGKGKIYYNDDRVSYEGQFNDGMLQGQGIMVWQNGDRYEGKWENDHMNGQGTYIWSSGKKYVGQWVNDSRTGKGIVYYSDGSRFEGYFANGIREGAGVEYYPNAGPGDIVKREGEWKNGERYGFFREYYYSGGRWSGRYVNGKKSGDWYYKHPDGSIADKKKYR